MARIMILGGYGSTGKSLARHLLAQSAVHLVLAGRSLDKAQQLADELNADYPDGRVSALRVDASDLHNLHQALDQVDLLLVAAPTTHYAETVTRAALDCGTDYLDVQLSAQKLALLQKLAPEIERAGRCFITEAGFHPGLPSAMIRYAAVHLDQLNTAITAGYLNMGASLPYTEAVDELMEVFQNYQAQVYKDGSWTKASSFDMRKVNFGDDIGERLCYSMFFEELRALPEMYPSLKEAGFYISSSHWMVDWVIYPLAMVALKIAPRRAARPVGKFVWWGMQTFPKPPYRVLLKLEASGLSKGKFTRIEAAVSHPDGYELTAIPVVACLMQYLDGSGRRPGLWMMGHLVEPLRLFKDMQRMGVNVSTTV